MTDYTLLKNRLHAGVWEGTLTGPKDASPVLVLRHDDEIVPGLTTEFSSDGTWVVRAPVPADRINDAELDVLKRAFRKRCVETA